jgi:hypothetical protein
VSNANYSRWPHRSRLSLRREQDGRATVENVRPRCGGNGEPDGVERIREDPRRRYLDTAEIAALIRSRL